MLVYRVKAPIYDTQEYIRRKPNDVELVYSGCLL